MGVQTDTGTSNRGREKAVSLGFLPEEERQVVLNVAAQILLPQENDRMRPEIVAHRKKIAEWSKRKRQQEREFGAGWNRGRNREPAPLFAEEISEEQRPRVLRIIDALAKAMTPLGWELTADLKFSREQDFVTLLFSESTDQVLHVPTKEENLKLLAPEKDHKSVFAPMKYIQQGVLESKEERQKFRHAPRFAPAGQSTQVIVGATSESDKDILFLSSALYGRPTMKRVYYSGYVSVNTYDKRLPALKQPPLVRENPALSG